MDIPVRTRYSDIEPIIDHVETACQVTLFDVYRGSRVKANREAHDSRRPVPAVPADAPRSVPAGTPASTSTPLTGDFRVKAEEAKGGLLGHACTPRKESRVDPEGEPHEDTSWLRHLDELDECPAITQQPVTMGDYGGDQSEPHAVDGTFSSSVSGNQVVLPRIRPDQVERQGTGEEKSILFAQQVTSFSGEKAHSQNANQQISQAEAPPKVPLAARDSLGLSPTVDGQTVLASEALHAGGTRDQGHFLRSQSNKAQVSQDASLEIRYATRSEREDSQFGEARSPGDLGESGDVLHLYGESSDQLNELLDVLLDDADL